MHLELVDGAATRRVLEAELPLGLVDDGRGLRLVTAASGEPAAWLDARRREDGGTDLFLDPVAGGARVRCNGQPLARATWLRVGDRLRLGASGLRVESDSRGWRLVLENAPSAAPPAEDLRLAPVSVRAQPFEPRELSTLPSRGWRPSGWLLVALALLLPLAAAALFLVLGRTVEIRLIPVGARAELEGLLTHWRLDGRRLLLPGRYRLEATAPGHHDLEAELVVGPDREQLAFFELRPLPGRLRVLLEPEVEAQIRLDGAPAQPLGEGAFELEPGPHSLLVLAEGYLPLNREILVRGRGEEQELRLELQEDAARLNVASEPTGTQVLTAEPGRLSVRTQPGGALLEVGGEATGRSPLELELAPILGRVEFDISPVNAELLVDGRLLGPVPPSLDLPARAHEIEIRAPGHATWSGRIEPEAERVSLLSLSLKASGQGLSGKSPARFRHVLGGEMVLIEPGRFTMGASRRDPGRSSDETLRAVELTRPFYLAANELTNEEFSAFDRAHASGSFAGHALGGARQPVVRVTWKQAALFCNWLSSRESLPAAYVERQGEWVAVRPPNEGYRLPTEAEWEWAARHDAEGRPWRFSWGDALPVPARAANLADETAASLLPRTVTGLRDGFLASAPVGSFPADRRGLHEMSGNVAEWVQDLHETPVVAEGAVTVDPLGPESGGLHVIRGSSWMHATLTELRLTFRDSGREARPDLGFRLARSRPDGGP